MPHKTAALALALSITLPGLAQDATKSSPAERQQWVDTLHKLEASPSDPQLISKSEGVVKRLIEVSDVHLTVCGVISELPSDYSKKEPILQLFMIGLAAYQVETGKTDNDGSNLYALHSVLKGYANLVAQNPETKNKKLDELAAMDAAGTLPKLISKKCKK